MDGEGRRRWQRGRGQSGGRMTCDEGDGGQAFQNRFKQTSAASPSIAWPHIQLHPFAPNTPKHTLLPSLISRLGVRISTIGGCCPSQPETTHSQSLSRHWLTLPCTALA